jgi:hypothetical protein
MDLSQAMDPAPAANAQGNADCRSAAHSTSRKGGWPPGLVVASALMAKAGAQRAFAGASAMDEEQLSRWKLYGSLSRRIRPADTRRTKPKRPLRLQKPANDPQPPAPAR